MISSARSPDVRRRGRRRALLGVAARTRRRRSRRRRRRGSGSSQHAEHLRRAPVHRRGAAEAEGFTDIEYVKVDDARARQGCWQPGRSTSPWTSSRPLVIALDAGDPDHRCLAGVHVGCFELFGTDRDPHDQGSEGQDGRGHASWVRPQHVFLSSMVGLRGAGPAQGHQLGRALRRPRASSCLRRARSTPSSGFRRTRRSCAPGRSVTSSSTARSTAVVAVLLLHARGQPGVRREASGRDQAGAAGDPEGGRHLRPGAGAGRAGTSSTGASTPRYDYRAPGAEGCSVSTSGATTTRRTPSASTPFGSTRSG